MATIPGTAVAETSSLPPEEEEEEEEGVTQRPNLAGTEG